MITRIIIALFALTVAFAILGASQPKIRKVPPSMTPASSGKQMYDSYCATCHGKDGKGGGPAAPALKVPPPDLTTMAARNGGKYPELHVFGTIQGDSEMPAAHGSAEMPVWGTVFKSMDGGSSRQLRIKNLTAYIESLQSK